MREPTRFVREVIQRIEAGGNPYLEEFNDAKSGMARARQRDDTFVGSVFTRSHTYDYFKFELREKLLMRYSYAIPSEEAIQTIVKYSPIVELGAGAGYWARMIAARGGEIVCYDADPDDKHWTEASYNGQYYPVLKGSAKILKKDQYKNYSLFLCWPPYDKPMAADCLKAYQGDHLIYVGESGGGCTGDEKFFDMIHEGWKEVEDVDIPQWHGIHDYLGIYERK